jgi:competence protein ComEA
MRSVEISVPRTPPIVTEKPENSSLYDLNRAPLHDLEALPGVGPKLARQIVDFRSQKRPFRSVEELRSIRGIGRKKLEKLRPYVIVRRNENR